MDTSKQQLQQRLHTAFQQARADIAKFNEAKQALNASVYDLSCLLLELPPNSVITDDDGWQGTLPSAPKPSMLLFVVFTKEGCKPQQLMQRLGSKAQPQRWADYPRQAALANAKRQVKEWKKQGLTSAQINARVQQEYDNTNPKPGTLGEWGKGQYFWPKQQWAEWKKHCSNKGMTASQVGVHTSIAVNYTLYTICSCEYVLSPLKVCARACATALHHPAL